MDERSSSITAISYFIHRYFLWFLVGSYVAAGFCPSFGIWIRDITLGHATVSQLHARITLPMLLLAFLLGNAGLGVQVRQLRSLLRNPLVLLVGLLANSAVPVAFALSVRVVMRWWHNLDEMENLLVGLALVAAMPVAGSSTAWSQNANGNVALSLGMVLLSTLLSPWTTPLALRSVSLMTTDSYSSVLLELAVSTVVPFLLLCVLLPCFLGVVVQRALGEGTVDLIKPQLKIANSAILLFLNYSNASVSLPSIVANPDWDFLAVTMVIVIGLCVSAFAAGWWVARWLGLGQAERIALTFGLGMNNNGAGLVLASLALADYPRAMLPIIFYNLTQHLVAGVVNRLLSSPGPELA
jgi:BASS family bile acid:Na+ symporter